MLSLRHRVRLANRLTSAWATRNRGLSGVLDVLSERLSEEASGLQSTALRLIYARARPWPSAQRDLCRTLADQLGSFGQWLARLARDLSSQSEEAPPADFWSELVQLEDEFGPIQVNWSEQSLSVSTETIEFEHVDLGPFAIALHWNRWQRGTSASCFEVIALEPNPAACNSEVVHPHVRAGEICPGDAGVPIERALAEGRLCDAFVLMRSVLVNYNDASPYVRIDQWSGCACDDCGQLQHPDAISYCEGCDHDFCEDCYSYCPACDLCRCLGCLSRCDVCRAPCCAECLALSGSEKSCCPDCLLPCPNCQHLVASNDLIEDSGLCPECYDAENEELPAEPEESNHESVAATTIPAQADPDLCADGVLEIPAFLPPG